MKIHLPLRPAATLIILASIAAASVRAEVIEQILVKVNGEIFTKTDLETRQITVLRQSGQLDANANPSDAQLGKLLDSLTPQLMVSVVDEILLVQRGHELGYTLSDDQFKSVLDGLKKDNKIDTDEQFQAALKQENMTLVELRKNLERQMIVDRVRQNEVLGKVGVSEDEARSYYDAHKNEFTTAEEITLREVLVAVPGGDKASPAADSAAQEKIDQIRKRALAGDSFEKLAADMSDAPSHTNAGLLGPLSLTEVSTQLQGLIGKMKVGDITDVLRAPNGYQILKLESRSAAQTMPFEEARSKIEDKVFTDKRQAEYQKYLEKLRAQAIIEWKNPEIEKSYKAGLEQLKQGVPSPIAPPPASH